MATAPAVAAQRAAVGVSGLRPEQDRKGTNRVAEGGLIWPGGSQKREAKRPYFVYPLRDLSCCLSLCFLLADVVAWWYKLRKLWPFRAFARKFLARNF